MSLYNGPPRPGARGGRGEFNWDNVKNDKDASYFLGHSVKALTGRWQKGRDVYWYTREKSKEDSLADEIRLVKEREEQLRLEALGLRPKQVEAPKTMDPAELAALLKKNKEQAEVDEGSAPAASGAAGTDGKRVQGLGFVPGALGGPGEAVRHTLAGVGVTEGEAGPSGRLPGPPRIPGAGEVGSGAALVALAASGAVLSSAQISELAKFDKKAAKRAKKEAKKAKKEAKKAKKAAKKVGKEKDKGKERESSPSSSSSSDDDSQPRHRGGGEARHAVEPGRDERTWQAGTGGKAPQSGHNTQRARSPAPASRQGHRSRSRSPAMAARVQERGHYGRDREEQYGGRDRQNGSSHRPQYDRERKHDREQGGRGSHEREQVRGSRDQGRERERGHDERRRSRSRSPRGRHGSSPVAGARDRDRGRTRHDTP